MTAETTPEKVIENAVRAWDNSRTSQTVEDAILSALRAAGFDTYNTKTHVAVPIGAMERVVDLTYGFAHDDESVPSSSRRAVLVADAIATASVALEDDYPEAMIFGRDVVEAADAG